jgi:hypothetical protein
VVLLIYKKKSIYLKINNAKQTFANPPEFGVISESLLRQFTSYEQDNQKIA